MCEAVVSGCDETIDYANTIYNKAIDDLRNELKTHYNHIDEMAKKLKKGGENEQ